MLGSKGTKGVREVKGFVLDINRLYSSLSGQQSGQMSAYRYSQLGIRRNHWNLVYLWPTSQRDDKLQNSICIQIDYFALSLFDLYKSI